VDARRRLDADSTLRRRDRTHRPFELRRSHPGLLLFHGPAGSDGSVDKAPLALAYVVGETPTTGIHQQAFDAAVADRDTVRRLYGHCPRALGEAADELRVVGPTFSGSIESLRLRVASWLTRRSPDSAAGGDGGDRHVTVVSGSATAPGNRIRLTRSDEAHVSFTATMNPVNVVLNTLCRDVLSRALGLDSGEVAVLEESSTPFGAAARSEIADTGRAHAGGRQGPSDACASGLTIPFPMSVSRLRAEYARHPVVTAPAPPMAIGRGGTRLPLDLEDPASSLESPPALSHLTSPAVERVMDDIGQMLLAHHVRVAVVVATDVRDGVFVATEVKRRLRDMRVVLFGSRGLYVRPEFNEELRGSLVVSSYPLFFENQYWTRLFRSSNERIVFTNELAEGAYNATLFQLAPLVAALRPSRTGACDGSLLGHLVDYRPPNGSGDGSSPADRRPPIWVTVVGRTTIAPVRAYPTRPDLAEQRFVAPRTCATGDLRGLASESSPTGFGGWELATFFVLAALLLAALLPAARRADAARPPARAADAPAPTAPTADAALHARTAGALWYVVACCAAAPLLLVPLRPLGHWWPLARVAVAGLGLAGFALLLVGGTFGWREFDRSDVPAKPSRLTVWQCRLLVALGVVYAAATAAFVMACAVLDPPGSAAFFTRALQLGSGVSPVVPLVVGGAVLLVWTQEHVHRARQLRRSFVYESWHTERALRIRRRLLVVADGTPMWLLAVAVGGVVLWILREVDRSPEMLALGGFPVFDWIFRALLAALIALTTWTTVRLCSTALLVRAELRELDRCAFVGGFERLPPCLHPLGRLTPLDAPSPAETDRLLRAELDVRLGALKRTAPSVYERVFSKVPDDQRSTSHWDAVSPLADNAAHTLLTSLERVDHPLWVPPGGLRRPPGREVAEEIAAIFATDYLAWALRHLRHLAIGLLASVGLGTLLLSSYAFEPHTFVRLCFFAVSGLGVVALVVALVQFNRDPVLSRITDTTGGKVTWDAPFLANLIAIVGIPVITLLGSQFPEVRDFLFGWLAPILKTVGHG
jgi:hypothetical protein